jgi:hypothetical protein
MNDFKLLHHLLDKKDRTNKSDRELKTLTSESRSSRGLGQYTQHSSCNTHSNSHLFPVFVSREEDVEDNIRERRDGDWMQLQGVVLRSDRLILRGEEINFGYVGSGRSGHFRKVFDCTCCWYTGRYNKRTHGSDQAWMNTLEQMWRTREWDTLSRTCDRYTTNPSVNDTMVPTVSTRTGGHHP